MRGSRGIVRVRQWVFSRLQCSGGAMSVRVVISAQQAKASSSMYSGTRDIVTAAAIAGLTFLPHFVRGGRTEEKPRRSTGTRRVPTTLQPRAPLRSGGLRVGFCCSLGCRQNEMAGWGTWHARHVCSMYVAYVHCTTAPLLMWPSTCMLICRETVVQHYCSVTVS